MSNSTQLSRRTVAKGAAWTTPALIMGAPGAFAATSSPCTTATTSWLPAPSSVNTPYTSTTGLTQDGKTITVNTVAQGSTRLSAANLSTAKDTSGGVYAGASWLEIAQNGNNSAGQVTTITFPSTVYCVTFYINDIDTQFAAASSSYRDDVTVTGFTASTTSSNVAVNGANATSTQTAGSATKTTYEWPDLQSTNGLVKFSGGATGLTSISITYKNTNVGSGTTATSNAQEVYISPIQYSTTPCAC